MNSSGLVGRRITRVEVDRSREFFKRRLLDLAKVLEQRLPPIEYDHEQIASCMMEHSVSIEIQIQIMDALKRGEYDTAREIWVTILPRIEIPFRRSRVWILYIKFHMMIERGHISYPIVQELFQNLPPETLRLDTCCGADDLLVQIEEEVRINQAIADVSPETSTDFNTPDETPSTSTDFNIQLFSEPKPNETPSTYTTSGIPTGNFSGKPNTFGKPDGFGQPGEPTPIPAGPVNIVYHPKLPDRQVVVVNERTVMIGTGGRGVFRMEHGYVAEALGHRIGHGDPLPGNQSDLVRSGVVIVNPTHAKVKFVFGSHEISLESGYQQVFHEEGTISFDRGRDNKIARHVLKPGTHEFEVGTDGWELNAKNYEVVISNEGNLDPFNYIVQGEQVSLAPEETKTHASSYPILIRLDRGDGSATKQIRWKNSQGMLQIAVNPTDNLWDLFAASEMQTREPTLQPMASFTPAF